jgi:hypothetical protein
MPLPHTHTPPPCWPAPAPSAPTHPPTNPPTHPPRLKKLARRGIDCKILSVSYPLAPEHRYPAGRDACEADIAWLLDAGASGEAGPVIVGESEEQGRGGSLWAGLGGGARP